MKLYIYTSMSMMQRVAYFMVKKLKIEMTV